MAIAATTLSAKHHPTLRTPAEFYYRRGKSLPLAIFAALSLTFYAMAAGQTASLADSVSQDPSLQIAVPNPRYTPTTLEIETVAACLVLEAASQGPEGMRGVMAVIRNRSHGLPELFEPVVLKRRQFSAFNRLTSGYEPRAHAIQRARRDRMGENALALVKEAQSPAWRDPTVGATHLPGRMNAIGGPGVWRKP